MGILPNIAYSVELGCLSSILERRRREVTLLRRKVPLGCQKGLQRILHLFICVCFYSISPNNCSGITRMPRKPAGCQSPGSPKVESRRSSRVSRSMEMHRHGTLVRRIRGRAAWAGTVACRRQFYGRQVGEVASNGRVGIGRAVQRHQRQPSDWGIL